MDAFQLIAIAVIPAGIKIIAVVIAGAGVRIFSGGWRRYCRKIFFKKRKELRHGTGIRQHHDAFPFAVMERAFERMEGIGGFGNRAGTADLTAGECQAVQFMFRRTFPGNIRRNIAVFLQNDRSRRIAQRVGIRLKGITGQGTVIGDVIMDAEWDPAPDPVRQSAADGEFLPEHQFRQQINERGGGDEKPDRGG